MALTARRPFVADQEVRMPTISERVANGAAELDIIKPDWWKPGRIKVSQLNLEDGCDCVLGQLQNYEQGTTRERLDLYLAGVRNFFGDRFNSARQAAAGFLSSRFGDDEQDYYDGEDEYEALTKEWRRVIKARRKAARTA
jgi:hypothetical protein